MNKQTNGQAFRPFPMIPKLVFQTFAQSFFELASGQYLVVQAGEKTKTISAQEFRNIEAVFNR